MTLFELDSGDETGIESEQSELKYSIVFDDNILSLFK